MSVAGHIIGGPVDADYDGAVLTADLAIGDTVLYVDDTADFDEDAARRDAQLAVGLDVDSDGEFSGGTALAYTTCDDDAGTVTLAAASPVGASSGDRVYLLDPVSGDPVGRLEVQVAIDDADTTGDPLIAYLDVALLQSVGDVDLTDLAVDIDEDEDGQLYISGFPGLLRRQGRIRFKALDTHTVTTLGDQSMRLTYKPLPQSEHLRWNGASQDYDDFTRDGFLVAIPDPDGVIEVGDILTMQYAYEDMAIQLGTMTDLTWGSTGPILIVAEGSTTDYSSPSFDDSGWTSAPTAVGYPLTPVPAVGWPTAVTSCLTVDAGFWIRRTVTVTGGSVHVTISARVDGQHWMYLDGDLIHSYSGSVAGADPTPSVTATLEEGAHLIALHLNDDTSDPGPGLDWIYGDIQVVQT